ncbi:GDP-mannose 4,6-dehydratase [Staphylothermus hellenicus]|uniref:NAD-dependent epimerase/dehydratase n=1 Tax=Staphylothermus hellenicus (strain DSM 12710 / JCM 10830 / BK20S6-10-b1 / P8) TaxID=591019 RepID=D7D856_STAHD|nr:GDP-mannose 4,6-dehydratase [Staphylothermus hellenicus]ADI31952.1 NAD-dependent epimerase/dehydratase [Staphylothermus hellenicus DSM 12710]
MGSNNEYVLVTGGAGFIGSWTVEKLCSKGYRVVVLDNLMYGSPSNLSNIIDDIILVKGDIRDTVLLNELFRKYRFYGVVHLAALVGVDEVYRDPNSGFSINVQGTFNLLEMSRRHDVERFVYASSAAVYGDPQYLPIDEDHPLSPKNLYGATKLAGEILVNTYMENYGLSTISLRYFNVYGPRMRPGPYSGVVYVFINNLIHGKPLIIHGDGLQTRDFVYVEDVAAANLLALESKITGSYNIGCGSNITVRELADILRKYMGREEVEIIHDKPREGDIKHSLADIGKAVKYLGWKPTVSLEKGLKKTIEYYKDYIIP